MSWWRSRSRAAQSRTPRPLARALAGPRPLVLAGVDGTRSGRLALLVAAEHAAGLGAELVGVHVSPALPWLWSASAELLALAPEWRQDVEADAFFDTAAAAEHMGVPWSFVVAEGDVATILRREARERGAALVVVASHAEHRGLHRCPARHLAETCGCPVIVVDGDVCGLLEEV